MKISWLKQKIFGVQNRPRKELLGKVNPITVADTV